jgi:hypothetical protein
MGCQNDIGFFTTTKNGKNIRRYITTIKWIFRDNNAVSSIYVDVKYESRLVKNDRRDI